MKSDQFTQKMVLGTVQLGTDYGITNASGRPSRKEALNILSYAWESGIRYFDTAPAYGSEKLIGEFVKKNGIQNQIKVLTKIPAVSDHNNFFPHIENTIQKSLENIGCNIEVAFLHKSTDSKLIDQNKNYFSGLRERYSINNLGVSVYEPEEVTSLTVGEFDLNYQFPFNILDRRFEGVKMNKGKRYARSIYLQGLLASTTGLRSGVLPIVENLWRKYHSLLLENKINPIQFATSFVANSNAVDYFLFGVESVAQLREIINSSFSESAVPPQIDLLVRDIDQKITDPRQWF